MCSEGNAQNARSAFVFRTVAWPPSSTPDLQHTTDSRNEQINSTTPFLPFHAAHATQITSQPSAR